MADPFYYRNVVQLRAIPGYTGIMNQSNDGADGFLIDSNRITNEYGFLNSHSFKMTSGNKLKSGNKLSYVFVNNNSIGGTQYGYFTFEARIRLTSLTVNTWLFEFPGTSVSDANKYGITAAGKLAYFVNTTANLTQTDSLVMTTGVDYHVAFVRATGGTNPGQRILMFINGNKVFDGNTTSLPFVVAQNANPTVIGGSFYNNTNDMVGYIDDIRISQFPRYLANFTPPTNSDFTTPSDSTWLPLRPGFQAKQLEVSEGERIQIYPARNYNHFIGDNNLDSIKSQVPLIFDYYGPNNIKGIAQIDGVPSPGMVIYLIHRASKRVIRITKSKPDGSYSFNNIQSGITFMILGEDNLNKSLVTRRNAYVRDFVRFYNPGEGLSTTLLKLTKPIGNATTGSFSDNFNLELENPEDLTIVTFTEDNYRKDTYKDNVSLYLDFAYNSGLQITDISSLSNTILKSGGAALINDTSIYGKATASFQNTGDYLEVKQNLDNFCFPGDFTLEVDFITTKTSSILIDRYVNGVSGYYQLWINAGKLDWYVAGTTIKSMSNVNNGTLKKIALSRSSGVLRLFVDGIKEAEVSDTANYSPSDVSIPGIAIGAQVYSRNTTYDFVGKIGKVRITKGVGRYVSDYTPDTLFGLEFSPSAVILTPESPINTFAIKSNIAGTYYFKTNNTKNLLNPVTDPITFI